MKSCWEVMGGTPESCMRGSLTFRSLILISEDSSEGELYHNYKL